MAGIGNIHETVVSTKEPTRVGEPAGSERYTVVYKTSFTDELMNGFFNRILVTVCRVLYSTPLTIELRYRQRECREGSDNNSSSLPKPVRFLLVYDVQLINVPSPVPSSPLEPGGAITTTTTMTATTTTLAAKKISQCPADLVISVDLFSQAFPWHFVLDRNLKIVQLGSSLLKLFTPKLIANQRTQQHRDSYKVTEFFQFVRPDLGTEISFEAISQRLNTPFLLRLVNLASHTRANQHAEV